MAKLSKRQRERLIKNILTIAIPTVLVLAVVLFIYIRANKEKTIDYTNAEESGLILIFQVDKTAPKADVDKVLTAMEKRAKTYSDYSEVYQKANGDIICKIPMMTKGIDTADIIDTMGKSGNVMILDEDNYNTFSKDSRYYVLAKNDDIVSCESSIEDDPNLDYDQTILTIKLNDEKSEKLKDKTSDGKNTSFYIYVDDELFAMAYSRKQITDGVLKTYDISDYYKAEKYATIIASGNYPVPVRLDVKHIN